MSVNKVILVGRLIKDPETKDIGESSVTEFTIATNESYKNKAGEKVEETEFHNIVFWGKRGKVIQQYQKKGDEIYLEGKKKTRSWDNDQGVKQYKTEIVAETFSFIGSKSTSTDAAAAPAPGDDLPF